MKSSKRIISFILAFAMGFSLYALPASADYISSENFGSWVTRNSPEFIQRWTHGFFGAGCTVSEDGRHHASSFQTDLGTGYYDCICSECGHFFRAYYQDSYDQAVSDLPAGTITSGGGFYLNPYINGIFAYSKDSRSYASSESYYNNPSMLPDPLPLVGSYSFNNQYKETDNVKHFIFSIGFSSFPSSPGTFYFNSVFPGCSVSTLGSSVSFSYDFSTFRFKEDKSLKSLNCEDVSLFSSVLPSYASTSQFPSSYVRNFPTIDFSSLSGINIGSVAPFTVSYDLSTLSRWVYFVPYNPINVFSSDTYNIDNRVGSLVGNYTYEGDNGTQIIAEDIQIVNETDQSVYNPVTNETYYYNEFTYNYGDRSYDFSFGDRDDHVSVTYGDDCVTIEDGDHTYTIYYTTASNHEHSYRITRVIDSTCTEQGKIYKTCSECGDELIEFTDALGHDWQITEQTAVDYVLPEARCPACESQYFTYELTDEVFYCICQDCGEEWNCNADVTEGHTTYTCSRCGEERTETNQEQDLSLFEAIGDLLADTFEWITDKLGQFINSLSGLSESFSSRIESLIESVGNYPLLFGAFLAGMPDDLMNIVWFGVIALVFVLVWKKFFS